MSTLLFFIISLIASIIGAISGIGGGMIIKPVLDATQLMSVSAINFLSSCTVLSMSAVSLLRSRNGSVPINIKMSTLLGIGAVLGGILGIELFEIVLKVFPDNEFVEAIQSAFLLLITVTVFLFIRFKGSIPSNQCNTPFIGISIGLCLGIISSFLGIGGGPLNIAFLYYFFSMDGKTAALNSLSVIFLSQIASLIRTILGNTVPVFDPLILVLMILGGVSGALIGSAINLKLNNKQVEVFFSCVLLLIAMINIWNIIRCVT